MTTQDAQPVRKSSHHPFVVRHAEPSDFEAVHRVYSGPKAISRTLRLSYASDEGYRKRLELDVFTDNQPAIHLYQ